MPAVDRIRQLFGTPELAWVVDRLRRRVELGQGLDGTITHRNPTESQRQAIARLLGRPIASGPTLTIRLRNLDALLRHAELCDGLIEAVAHLSGPLTDRRALRESAAVQWHQLFEDVGPHIGRGSALQTWLDNLRATGLLQRLARGDVDTARAWLGHALEVARRLPASGIPLAELAAAVTGDSHALDAGEPLGTLVVRLAATQGGAQGWRSPADRRDVWASVGVLCDELSAPVLTINLRGAGTTATDRALTMHAETGEPYRLSIRQLLRTPPTFTPLSSARTVYICENPTVVAAVANRLGPSSAPLICVEGQPKTAACLLLARLAITGTRLLFHGDFDWGGVRIANVIIARYGAVPWRYSAADYRAATAGTTLHGSPITACWDADLMPTMVASGHVVYEEQVLAVLLNDLAIDVPDTG